MRERWKRLDAHILSTRIYPAVFPIFPGGNTTVSVVSRADAALAEN